MRRFFEILFVIAIVIVAYETFKPQAPFPQNATTADFGVAVSSTLHP